MLTKIADSWIDITMVTAVGPYMDDSTKDFAVVKLMRGEQIVKASAESAAKAINKALQEWKASEKCANQ